MSQDAWRRYLPGGGWRYDVEEPGLKANLTDLACAIGREQLRSLPAWQARRTRIAAQYDAQLMGVPGLRRPHRPQVEAGRHAWHLYAVQLDGAAVRDHVVETLARRGIGTSVHFIPVHRLTHFAGLVSPGALPGADAMFDGLLSLPMYPRLSAHQVDDVAAALVDALKGARR